MARSTFDRWYAEQYDEWFHDWHKELKAAWDRLLRLGVPADVIAETFSEIVYAIKDQYGD